MTQRPAPNRPTIYDVADEAGVAISTVSRVLNGSAEVSDATRSRVRHAIRKLNFRPQRTARNLAQGSTTSVAVALPSATSLFFVEMLKGVKDALRERDIDLLLCNLGSGKPHATLQRFLNRGAVDALLLMGTPIEGEFAEQLLAFPAPVVLLGAQAEGLDAYWWNDEDGAYRAVSFLIEQGHRQIGLIASHAWSATSGPRLVGYKRALAEADIPFDPALVVSGQTTKHAGYSEEAGAEAMGHLLALENRPTGVFASSDVQAFGAWAYARDQGLIIPRDLSIVGYDDIKLSRFLDLTTVSQGMHRAGLMATERLLHRIGSTTDERISVELPLTLVERGSTARAKA